MQFRCFFNILILFIFSSQSWAQSEPTKGVVDTAQVLTSQEIQDLNQLLNGIERQTGITSKIEIIPSTFEVSFDDYLSKKQSLEGWQNKERSSLFIVSSNDKRAAWLVSPDLEFFFDKMEKVSSLKSIEADLSASRFFVGLAKLASIWESQTSFIKVGQAMVLVTPLWYQRSHVYWLVLLSGFCLSLIAWLLMVVSDKARVKIYSSLFPLIGMLFTSFIFRHTPGFWWAYAFCFSAGYFFGNLLSYVYNQKSRLIAGFLLFAFYLSSIFMFFRKQLFLSDAAALLEVMIGHLLFLIILVAPFVVIHQIVLVILPERKVGLQNGSF